MHMTRDVKVYPLFESELESLSSTNTRTVFYSSIASVSGSAALSCFLAGQTVPQPSTMTQAALFVLAPWILGFIALAFVVAAAAEWRRGRSTLTALKATSQAGGVYATDQ